MVESTQFLWRSLRVGGEMQRSPRGCLFAEIGVLPAFGLDVTRIARLVLAHCVACGIGIWRLEPAAVVLNPLA